MLGQQINSFGSWTSPITAGVAVAETGSLSEPRIDGNNIYWIEARPLEKGRNIVVARAADGTIRDVTPSPFSVRSQVYSYGGDAYAVSNNVMYFVNFGDNQIYQQVAGGVPTKITSSANCLFADICVDAARNWLIAIKDSVSSSAIHYQHLRRYPTSLGSGKKRDCTSDIRGLPDAPHHCPLGKTLLDRLPLVGAAPSLRHIRADESSRHCVYGNPITAQPHRETTRQYRSLRFCRGVKRIPGQRSFWMRKSRSF